MKKIQYESRGVKYQFLGQDLYIESDIKGYDFLFKVQENEEEILNRLKEIGAVITLERELTFDDLLD